MKIAYLPFYQIVRFHLESFMLRVAMHLNMQSKGSNRFSSTTVRMCGWISLPYFPMVGHTFMICARSHQWDETMEQVNKKESPKAIDCDLVDFIAG